MSAALFHETRRAAGLSRGDAADLLGVSLRTIGHWETGACRVPYAPFKLLRILRNGELIDPAWTHCRIIRGKLVTPENHEIAPHDLAWLTLLVRRAAAFSDLLASRDRRPDGGSGPRRTPLPLAAGPVVACVASPAVAGSNAGCVSVPASVPRVERTPPELPQNPEKNTPLPGGGVLPVAAVLGLLSPCSNTGWTLEPRSGDPCDDLPACPVDCGAPCAEADVVAGRVVDCPFPSCAQIGGAL